MKLQKIKCFDYPNCTYEDIKNMHFKSFNQFLKEGCNVRQAVNGHYCYGFNNSMDENGMDKFVAMLAGTLFMIDHNDIELDQIHGTRLDIRDFESGEYNELFTAEDIKLINLDIKKIKQETERM